MRNGAGNKVGVGSFVLLSVSALMLSGCVVRTYPLTRERVDQDLSTSSGNRGYLMGSAPAAEVEKERSTTRTTQIVEVEFHPLIKFDRKKPVVKTEAMENAPAASVLESGSMTEDLQPVSAPAYKKYTVGKGDTLQKISMKFYGTTKKWMKIYDANRGVLKSPDRVRPGQVLDIPDVSESLQEPAQNLK